ncbi:MAG: hypothetical protein MZV63_46255 [Marinilabiliales bacterium]|nr:hypothetical protein [Marinilabiliales bacterium]
MLDDPPLKNRQPVEERLDMVGYLIGNSDASWPANFIRETGDLERPISRWRRGQGELRGRWSTWNGPWKALNTSNPFAGDRETRGYEDRRTAQPRRLAGRSAAAGANPDPRAGGQGSHCAGRGLRRTG